MWRVLYIEYRNGEVKQLYMLDDTRNSKRKFNTLNMGAIVKITEFSRYGGLKVIFKREVFKGRITA